MGRCGGAVAWHGSVFVVVLLTLLVYLCVCAGVMHALEHEAENAQYAAAKRSLAAAGVPEGEHAAVLAALDPGRWGQGAGLWTFSGACLYCVGVVTAVGWGRLPPATAGGRTFTAAFFLPGVCLVGLLICQGGRVVRAALDARRCRAREEELFSHVGAPAGAVACEDTLHAFLAAADGAAPDPALFDLALAAARGAGGDGDSRAPLGLDEAVRAVALHYKFAAAAPPAPSSAVPPLALLAALAAWLALWAAALAGSEGWAYGDGLWCAVAGATTVGGAGDAPLGVGGQWLWILGVVPALGLTVGAAGGGVRALRRRLLRVVHGLPEDSSSRRMLETLWWLDVDTTPFHPVAAAAVRTEGPPPPPPPRSSTARPTSDPALSHPSSAASAASHQPPLSELRVSVDGASGVVSLAAPQVRGRGRGRGGLRTFDRPPQARVVAPNETRRSLTHGELSATAADAQAPPRSDTGKVGGPETPPTAAAHSPRTPSPGPTVRFAAMAEHGTPATVSPQAAGRSMSTAPPAGLSLADQKDLRRLLGYESRSPSPRRSRSRSRSPDAKLPKAQTAPLAPRAANVVPMVEKAVPQVVPMITRPSSPPAPASPVTGVVRVLSPFAAPRPAPAHAHAHALENVRTPPAPALPGAVPSSATAVTTVTEPVAGAPSLGVSSETAASSTSSSARLAAAPQPRAQTSKRALQTGPARGTRAAALIPKRVGAPRLFPRGVRVDLRPS